MRDLPRQWPEWIDCKATMILLVAAISASASQLLGHDQSALTPDPAKLATEPWRLFTSTLLHGNWMHLAMNVYWTVRLGFVIEHILGLGWTVALYLFLGFGSSAAQWAFDGPGIGLSGIGYGLFGLLWSLYRFHPRYRPAIDDHVIELFSIWFFVCIGLDWFDVMPIGNWAHGSGAVLGGLLGWTIAPRRFERGWRVAALALACLAIGAAATVARPWVNPGGVAGERAASALGEIAVGQGEKAIADLEAAVRAAPDSAPLWFALGMARIQSGDLLAGTDDFERAWELDPDNVSYRKVLAIQLWIRALGAREAGQHPVALGHLRRAVELDPDSADLWAELGAVLEDRGDHEAALEARSRARSLEPESEALPVRIEGAPAR